MARLTRAMMLISVVVGLCLNSFAHSKEVESQDVFKNIPSEIEVEYYPIHGETLQEIDLSLTSFGPKDHSGARRTAVFDWNFEWVWYEERGSSVNVAATKIEPRYFLKMPHLPKPPQSASISKAWARYLNAVVSHELNHFKNAVNCVDDLRQAISRVALKSERAEKQAIIGEARQVLKECSRRDMEYDSRTRNGKQEGVELIISQ